MKLKIKITGKKVHGVGYRPWLTDAAIDAGIMGFYAANRMENKEPVVIVLAEGDEWSISHFEELVRNGKPEFAHVDRIDAEDYTGDIMSLDKYAAINTCSQMNKAIPLLLSMNNKMDQTLDKQDQMLNRQDQMLGKQDQMLGKQDETIGSIRSVDNKMDQMLEKQDETISEIRDLRDDLVIHSSANRLSRIEKDIRSIKTKIEIR
jgi:acylphosphatase